MENITYRVERSADGHFVGCYFGREAVDVYSQPLRRVAWWELLPWQECPPFETGNYDLGCFVLACSILSHHFGEEPEVVQGGPLCEKSAKKPSQTYTRFFAFAVEIIRTQALKPGEFYIITTEVINEWLEMKRMAEARRPDPTPRPVESPSPATQ